MNARLGPNIFGNDLYTLLPAIWHCLFFVINDINLFSFFQEHDVPWEQHAIWFPKCNYLLLRKSREYVDQVNNKRRVAEEENTTSTSTAEPAKKDDTPASPPKPDVSSETNTKEADDSNSATLCKICYAKEVGVVFLPCGHVVACVECAPSLSQCAVCRKPLEATFRAFLS